MPSVCLANTTKIYGTKMLPELQLYINDDNLKYLLFANSEVISDQIRKDGYWNKHILDYLKKILLKQDSGVIVDIGAGMGSVTVPLAQHFGPKFIIHCFEPLRILHQQLCANIFINSIDHVHTHNVALSKKREEVVYGVLDIHNLNNHGTFSFNEDINKIRNILLTDYKEYYSFDILDNYEFTDVKFIKLSAPGMEPQVIEGATETIKRNNNPPILFEHWNVDWYNETIEKVFEMLKTLGYRCFIDIGGYFIAFKTEAFFEFLTQEKNINDDSIVIKEKSVDAEMVLKNQAVYK